MEFSSKSFRNVVTLMAIGALASACAPVPVATPSASGPATRTAASKNTTTFGQPAPVLAQPKDGTAFYPTSDGALGKKRATLVPPEQAVPEYQTAAAAVETAPAETASRYKPQTGSRPVRGYQSGRVGSDERDSFDGVDVASSSDSGADDTNTGGGSAGGGSSTTASF